jgi:hypothetical protein
MYVERRPLAVTGTTWLVWRGRTSWQIVSTRYVTLQELRKLNSKFNLK